MMTTRGSKRRAPHRREDDSLFDFDFSTAVVMVHASNPNLVKGNNNSNSNTRRRRISSHKVKVVDNELVSKFFKDADDDILGEIFLRLPNCRSTILFSSVCHRWHALISQPQFIPRFIRLHPDDEPCTFLFCRNVYVHTDEPNVFRPVCKLFSRESLFLHGKHATSSNYFDFMFSPQIMASCNDLLLVSSLHRFNAKFYVCNPVTKWWFLLPGDLPFISVIGFALICIPDCSNELVFSTNAQYQFKAVLIQVPVPPNVGESGDCRTIVTVFCSKSGQWSELWFSYPQPTKNDYTFSAKVVSCNGIIYWMDGQDYLDRVLALDLFNSHCGAICLPHVIHDDASCIKVQLGAVRGELRLLHIYRTRCSSKKCFVIKVWELNRGDNSWVSALERNLSMPNVGKEKMASAVFHPKNCDVVFMIWGMTVFEYRISKDMFYKLGELQESIGEEGLECYPLVHPAWPTPVPSHPPSI